MASARIPDQRLRLLFVDDDQSLLPSLKHFVEPLGFDIEYRSNGREALDSLSAIKPDVAIVDFQMPGLSGIDVLKSIRAAEPGCQVILMTGHVNVDIAIEAVKAGALDYLSKPFDADRLRALLMGVRESREDREHLLSADAEMAERIDFHGMIGRSPEMQDLFAAIRRLAPHARTVLISGETGTGKELVARALHREGRRQAKRFVTVNCSAVVETLFESELFGHVRGAFTGATENKVGLFEHAQGGTLFLDEIGELPRLLQPKLLRAVELGEIQRVGSLETRSVDVSVIAATNRDLRAEIDAGRFRGDLYYRLGIIEIRLSPLRERRDDIPLLAAAFIREFSKRFDRPISGLTQGADRLLQQSDWPGNVRELRNVLERASLQTSGGILSERELTAALASRASSQTRAAPEPEASHDSHLLSTAQRDQIRRVLKEVDGNKAAAAKQLGISRRSLYRWLERLDLNE